VLLVKEALAPNFDPGAVRGRGWAQQGMSVTTCSRFARRPNTSARALSGKAGNP